MADDPEATSSRTDAGAGGGRQDALRAAADAIGDRWKLLIVAALLDGPRRFGDLERDLEGIAPNVLSSRLRDLEADGLVIARPYCERPPRYAYELTGPAHGLAGALDLLARWATGARGAEPPAHGECGTPLEAGWFCPTCARPVSDPDAEDLDFA